MIKSFTSILLLFLMFTCTNGFSQKRNKILFKIDGQPQLVSDFLKNYNKNSDIIADSTQKNIDNYLQLYINFRLKVLEAKAMKLDTNPEFIGELSRYKQQLMIPYLKDTLAIEKLVKEAYERTKYEINASHILIRVDEYAKPADTLIAYQKIEKALQDLKNGKPFEDVASQYSEDPSVKNNRGNLGYFKVFSMVYSFENAAYNTPVGEISKIFRTRFGYHIVKVIDKRLSQGTVQVAHIMLKNQNILSDKKNNIKIDSLYDLLLKGEDFTDLAKKYSQDSGSSKNGGLMPQFEYGKIIKSFADQAFALSKIDSFSKPFKTEFGWHIVKLIKKFPVATYDSLKLSLLENVKRGDRAESIEQTVIDKLKKNYKIIDFESAFAQFYNDDWYKKADSLKANILKVQDSVYTQHDFVVYLKFKQLKTSVPYLVYQQFRDRKIMDYYKSNLERSNLEFASAVNDFREGLLLFNVMENQVWEKAQKDSIGLDAYYMLNRNKYPKELKDYKGAVMNDYQNYLEQEWILNLRKKYTIDLNKSALKRIKKTH